MLLTFVKRYDIISYTEYENVLEFIKSLHYYA